MQQLTIVVSYMHTFRNNKRKLSVNSSNRRIILRKCEPIYISQNAMLDYMAQTVRDFAVLTVKNLAYVTK